MSLSASSSAGISPGWIGVLASAHDVAELKRDMKEQEMRLTIKFGAMLVISISVVATLVKLL